MTAGRKAISTNKDWCTPQKYVDAIKKFWNGHISLDPCSNIYSVVHADTEYVLPQNDGLIESWNYSTIYVNPPYGNDPLRRTKIKDWLQKCANAYFDYNSEVIALIPVAPNTLHWKMFVFGAAAAICFLKDTRLKFLEHGEDVGKGAPMACCLVYWGDRYSAFFKEFIQHGSVVDLRPLRLNHKIRENIFLQQAMEPALEM